MIDSKKDEWMKAQEDAMEEDNGDNQSDDEISLTYLTGSDVPGSVDEVRSKPSASRLATLRPQLHKSHSHNLRSTTFSSLKIRSSPRLFQNKATQSISESTAATKTAVTKLRKTTDKISVQVQSESETTLSSLVSKSQPKSFIQKLSTEKLPKAALSRQTRLGVKESSCARVVPLSVAFTKSSNAMCSMPSSTRISNSSVSSFSTPSFPLLSCTSSSKTSSRISDFTSFSPSLSASYSVVGGDRTSLVRRQTFSSPSVTNSYRSSQHLRTAAGSSKISTQATAIRRRCESGSFEFVKPVSSIHKASNHQSLPGMRIKPTLGDYERPRLCLRKRSESRSGETESSSISNTGSENISESG
ncbi:unnamed protein product [Brugia timori]|uniref:Flocculation protein FLO11-like n=1 Tax=Brugia timori TaxID=42155 RepID=A0A0R3QU42_9BILA|nr:unnamed protein product [Brugia timori]